MLPTSKFEFLFTEDTVEIIMETLICRKEIKRYRTRTRRFFATKIDFICEGLEFKKRMPGDSGILFRLYNYIYKRRKIPVC